MSVSRMIGDDLSDTNDTERCGFLTKGYSTEGTFDLCFAQAARYRGETARQWNASPDRLVPLILQTANATPSIMGRRIDRLTHLA